MAILLLGALVVSACGSTGGGDAGGADVGSADAGSADTSSGQVQSSASSGGTKATFDTVHKGKLTAASTLSYPPLEMMDGDKPTGFEVEIVEALGANLGYTIDWVKVDFSGIVPGVAAKKYDLAASGITGWMPPDSPAKKVLKPRLEQVALTRPYYLYPSVIVTNKKKHHDLKSVDDLKSGMKVALVAGTHIFEWAKDQLPDRGITIQVVKDSTQQYTELSAGIVDATIDVKTTANEAAKNYDSLVIGDEVPALEGGYSIAVAPDNHALLAALDRALTNIMQDGTYEKIFKKYFPDQKMPDLPSEPLTLSDF